MLRLAAGGVITAMTDERARCERPIGQLIGVPMRIDLLAIDGNHPVAQWGSATQILKAGS